MKVYLFQAQDENASVHATLKGAKAQWEKVKNNFSASEKHEWIEDGLDDTCARMAVKIEDMFPFKTGPLAHGRWVSSAWIYEMEVQE